MSFRRNVIANYLGQAWVALMGLAFIPLYIRYLGIEAYGLIGLFALLQAWLTLLDVGMTPTLSREMARFTADELSAQAIRNLLRSIEMIVYGVAVGICIAVWAVSAWLTKYWLKAQGLPISQVENAIVAMAFLLSLRFIESIYHSALLGLQRQVWYNGANAALATLRSVGTAVILATVSPTIVAFFLWQVVISIFSIIVISHGVYSVIPKPRMSATFSLKSIKSIWRFARGMTGISLLVIFLTQIDKVLLSRLLSLEEFGYYTLASVVAGAIYMVTAPIITALFPHLVQLASSDKEEMLADAYHEGAQLVTMMLVPAAMLLAFFGEGILFAWSGSSDLALAAGPIVSILAIGTLLNGLMTLPYHLQLAHGWTSLTLRANAIAVMLLVPAIFYAVPKYGALGAAIVWVILNAGYILIIINLMHRRLLQHEKWKWYLWDVGFPTISVVLVLQVLSYMRPIDLSSRLSWLYYLIMTLCSAIAVSTGTLRRIRKRLWTRLQRLQSAG